MMRCYADNVLVRILPEQNRTAGGLFKPDQTTYSATSICLAEVIASGPGHHRVRKIGAGGCAAVGPFIPNQTKPGDVVLIDRMAGQDWGLDVSAPRHNQTTRWTSDGDEYRMIREDEVHAVVNVDADADANACSVAGGLAAIEPVLTPLEDAHA